MPNAIRFSRVLLAYVQLILGYWSYFAIKSELVALRSSFVFPRIIRIGHSYLSLGFLSLFLFISSNTQEVVSP